MAQEKGGAGGPLEGRRRSLFGGGAGAALRDSWLAKNWQTLLVLGMIVLLAFFIRSYFVYGASVDNGNLFSGGSDSYYHQRVIDYVSSTGHHLVDDPALNYPFGMRNPRLPLYDWSCAVTGMIGSALTGTPVEAATSYVL
ncbi:MAG TPA: hypothetical protein VEH08_06390, partial [Methanomassiliicoccales archaeon]|nr:hypothetical protein [Methanomassiliicoccales archaeon]